MEELAIDAWDGLEPATGLDSIIVESPLGPIRLMATREALVAVRLPGSGAGRPDHDATPSRRTENAVLNRAAGELEAYFAGRLRTFSTPLPLRRPSSEEDLRSVDVSHTSFDHPSSDGSPSPGAASRETPFRGTSFQERVWRGLLTIPYGERRSYAWLAEKIGHPGAYRAVGAANGRNPLAIVVPCHRVIGADGSLTGYGGGLEAKRWLLEHEAAQADLFFA